MSTRVDMFQLMLAGWLLVGALLVACEILIRVLSVCRQWFRRLRGHEDELDFDSTSFVNSGFRFKKPDSAARRHFGSKIESMNFFGFAQARKTNKDSHSASEEFRENLD